MDSPGILIKEFIKKHIKIEEQLQKRIDELENEIKLIQSNKNDYFLYKDILKLIMNNIQFQYNEIDGGYTISIDSPIHMPNELIDELVKDIQKYKEENFNNN